MYVNLVSLLAASSSISRDMLDSWVAYRLVFIASPHGLFAFATEESRYRARCRSVSFWCGADAGFTSRARVTSGYEETDAAVAAPQLFREGFALTLPARTPSLHPA